MLCNECHQVRRSDADCIANTYVGQLAPLAQRVDRGGAHAEPSRDFSNAEQIPGTAGDALQIRGQGGDKFLAKPSNPL